MPHEEVETADKKYPLRGRRKNGDPDEPEVPETPEAPPEPTQLPAGTVRLINRDGTHVDHELPDPEKPEKGVIQFPFRLSVAGKLYERSGVVDGNETYSESV